MNERFRELAQLAVEDAAKYCQRPFDLVREENETFALSFAELILKDVFNRFGDEILSLHYLEQGCCQDSVHLLKSKIQEHFGVKDE